MVRGSNAGCGGSTVLTRHGDKRRSRASLPNAFVESLLGAGSTTDELFHVGRASISVLAFQSALRAFDTFRAVVMASIIIRMLPMVVPAALGRFDTCVRIFKVFCARSRLTIQVSGEPATVAGGVLWVSNHFTWMDYPVLQMASKRLLRVVARADMGARAQPLSDSQFRRLGTAHLRHASVQSRRVCAGFALRRLFLLS